ncbi:patatin-like phospholipase family protein [Sedimentibacter sp. zth1]|uniref:patatin-like phospholipase family protein n=1 Tax=Sedimentibacter sp. zth1 TaxID=2816908 RepID=UPI001A939F85|nr:patatin-like phospholipase family protein [Sedimentibacter sp. zth1]QSX06057.1 patatin-like phospholipase family protein [Sedimentibacter sp. zth1]
MYGLVLEGGGAKGAYHVGAYKALLDLGIKIDGVAGTSIGALNGAAIVQGDYDKLVDIWNEIDLESLFGFNKEQIENVKSKNFADISLSYFVNLSKNIITNKGLDTSKIRKLVSSFIDEEKVRNSKLDFGIVTISLTDKQPIEILKENIPKGKLIDYILASSNLPVFKMQKVDGKFFLDGGAYDNLPFGVLQKKGYKNFIAVRTYGIGRVKKVNTDEINVIYIQPVEDLGGILDFDVLKAKTNISLGYYDAMKVFKQLKGYKYYCKQYKNNFLKYLLNNFDNNEQRYINIGKLLGFEDIPTDRMLFEKILPRLESLLEMKGKFDYQDIILRLVECIAEKYSDIKRFKIYDADDFIKIVIDKFKKEPLSVNKKIPTFVRQNKILSLAVKDDLVIRIFREMFI